MNRLLVFSERINQSYLVNIMRRTFEVLFPIMLLGSFAEVIKYSFLTPSGYVNRLFNMTSWLPFHSEVVIVLGVIFHCTINMIALYGAYASAYFTAKTYSDSEVNAGPIGILAFLLVSVRPSTTGVLNFSTELMAQGLLIAMVIAAFINVSSHLVNSLQIPTYIASFVTQHTQTDSLWYVIAMGLLTDLLAWLAVGGPFTGAPTFTDAPAWANMNAALRSGSSWNVPYKFTDTTLFHSFANFGGSGVTLALIIAILLFSKKRSFRTVSKWSIFPALFNNHYSMMLGIPILFNPVFVIPFVLAPVVNMLIAALFMVLKWMPIPAYPVPAGTPGPLIAFIGTNGNWLALALGTALIALDVFIYLPFVRIADKLNMRGGAKNE